MNSFSSWGTTGDLAIKPEITAPGGSIYSVNGGTSVGAATDRYTVMSGTSMASPHIAGISTLINEYIGEHGYQGEFANPTRGLSQSLLMSTAVPIVEGENEDGVYYYPILQQGAGLANVAAATSADSYIKMDSDATASYDDGKVVAELGDDPDRTGVYSFSFEIHNLDMPERNAVSNSFVLASGEFNLSRNATQSLIQVVCLDTQEEYYSISKQESYQGAARNNYTEAYGLYTFSPNARISDLQEGETVKLSAVFLPEYYEEGKRGADEAYETP